MLCLIIIVVEVFDLSSWYLIIVLGTWSFVFDTWSFVEVFILFYSVIHTDTWSFVSCSYRSIGSGRFTEEPVWSQMSCSVTDHWTCSVTGLCSVVSRKLMLLSYSVTTLLLCGVFRPNFFILMCINLYQTQYYHVYILQLVLSCHLHLFLFSHNFIISYKTLGQANSQIFFFLYL